MTHVRRPNRRRVPGLDALVNGGSCPATGKIRYLDERTANLARDQVAVKDPDRDRLGSYQCDRCGDWHIGHQVAPR